MRINVTDQSTSCTPIVLKEHNGITIVAFNYTLGVNKQGMPVVEELAK